MMQIHSPNQNYLLAALPADVLRNLLPHLELVQMQLGDIIYEPINHRLEHVYFPTTAIVSLLHMLKSGDYSEIAGIGKEGMLCVSVFIKSHKSVNTAIVQTSGYGYKIKANIIKQEFDRGDRFQWALLRYLDLFISHISQISVCSRHHSIEEQLSRFLLLVQNRTSCHDIVMTQELIAHTLGVRREGISEAARKLQFDGAINFSRGHIQILNREALKMRSCECYNVISEEIERFKQDLHS